MAGSEITINDVTRPVLALLAEGCRNTRECLPHLVKHFRSTLESDSAEPVDSRTYLGSRARWALVSLGQAGLIEKAAPGDFRVTEAGRKALSERVEPFDHGYLLGFPGYAAANGPRSMKDHTGRRPVMPAAAEADAARTPEEVMDSALERADNALAGDLLDRLLVMDPARFEQLIVELVVAMGYGGGVEDAGRAIGGPGDGGIDGIINEDPLGLDRVYIQAKRYALDSKISRPVIQQFVGSLTGEGATKGVFVTTSDFSADARTYAERVQQRIILIDGQRLARLMIAHEIGVRARRTYVLRSVDEDSFVEN